MNPNIHSEKRNGYFLVRIKGPFNFRILAELREQVETAVGQGEKNVAFDLTPTSLVDSGGIGFIANLNQKLVGAGGSAYLIAVPEEIVSTFEAAGLLPTVPALLSVREADLEIASA